MSRAVFKKKQKKCKKIKTAQVEKLFLPATGAKFQAMVTTRKT